MDQIKRFIHRDLPHIVGTEAVNHYTKNFQKQGFEGKKWKKPLRHKTGKGADKTRPTLTGETGELGRSLSYKAHTDYIRITSDVPYAKIHNKGGRIKGVQYVKPHKRTVKEKRMNIEGYSRKVDIIIPKRRFVGRSKALSEKLFKEITFHIKKQLRS